MKKIKRRDFLRYAGAAGILMLSAKKTFHFLGQAFAEKINEIHLTASVASVDIGTGKAFNA